MPPAPSSTSAPVLPPLSVSKPRTALKVHRRRSAQEESAAVGGQHVVAGSGEPPFSAPMTVSRAPTAPSSEPPSLLDPTFAVTTTPVGAVRSSRSCRARRCRRPRRAIEHIGAVATVEAVVADPAERLSRHRAAFEVVVVQVPDQQVRAVAAVERIVAGAPVELLGPGGIGQTEEPSLPALAAELVQQGVPAQHIIAVGAGIVLDADPSVSRAAGLGLSSTPPSVAPGRRGRP